MRHALCVVLAFAVIALLANVGIAAENEISGVISVVSDGQSFIKMTDLQGNDGQQYKVSQSCKERGVWIDKKQSTLKNLEESLPSNGYFAKVTFTTEDRTLVERIDAQTKRPIPQ